MEVLSVTESIAHYLRVHIITGELLPKEKLNEVELASRLGVSRAPLREAFRLLATEQLIVSLPRRGCLVTGISVKACQDIFESREMMECFAIELLKEKRIKDLPEVESALAKSSSLRMPIHSDPYEKFEYFKSIVDFHVKLVQSANNRSLAFYYHLNFPSYARYLAMYTYTPRLMKKSKEEHERIFELIKKGYHGKARKALTDHIRYFAKSIINEMNYGHKAASH